MDEPDASSTSGPPATRRRSSRASASGSLVDIGGLALEVRATKGPHRDVVDRLLGGMPPGHGPASSRLEFSRRPVALPRRPPDEDYPDIAVWHEGRTLFLRGAHQTVHARVDPERVRVSSADPYDELGFRHLFRHITTHLLLHHDTFVVHGAALRRDGFAVLAMGPSGAGKSTVVLAALEHGWSVLSDDLVALRRTTDGISIQGIPKPLALPGDLGAASLSESTALEWDARRRRHLGAEQLDTGVAQLAMVLAVGHADGTAWVGAIDRDEVLSLVLSSFASARDASALRRFFPVAVDTARLPCARLLHSADPARRLAEAARVLDDLRVRSVARDQ